MNSKMNSKINNIVKPAWRISTFENVNKTHLLNIEKIQRYINSHKYQKNISRRPSIKEI